jgi:hypothetical protein
MNLPRHQRGFMEWAFFAVGALIVLGLGGRFVYWVITEESFVEVAAILWPIGFGLAYWFTLNDLFVARMPMGFAVFLLVAAAALPLTWMAESRIALVVLIAVQLAFSYHAGHVLSGRLRARYPGGVGPAWSRRGDVVADFGNWVLLGFGALIYLLAGPLFVMLVVSAMVDLAPQQVKWTIATWDLMAILWFSVRAGSVRWLGVPVCAWTYLAVTVALVTADALAGPFAAGTGVQVAYTVMPGALVAAFVEVFVLGGGKISNKEEAA